MPEAVLAASFRAVRNTAVLAVSYPRPPATYMVADLLVSSTAYATLDGRRMLDRLLAAKGPKWGSSLGPTYRRAIRDARRARWRQVIHAGAGLTRGGRAAGVMVPDVRLHRPPMERRGVAGRLPVRAVTDISRVGRLAPGPATRRRVPGERDTWVAPAPATLDRDVAMRPGGVWLVRPFADLDPDTPAYVVAQTATAVKSPDKPGMAIVGPWPMADEKSVKGPVFWVWPLPLTVKDPGKVAGVDRRMPMLSFPIHDALIVHRWPLAIRDLSLRPVAPEPPIWWARPEREIPIWPAMRRVQVWLATFAPVADGRAAAMLWAGDAGHRLQDKHDAAVLAIVSGRRPDDRAAATFVVPAGRRPSEHDAARLPLFAGRRFPTEHDALRFVLRTLRRVTDHGATTLARILARRPTDHGAARLLAPRSGTRRPRSDRGAVFRPVIQADMAERQAAWSLVAGWPVLAHVGARDALAVMPVDLAARAAVPAVVLAPPVPIDAKAPKAGATMALALAGHDPDRGAVVAPAVAMAAHDPSRPAVVAATLVLLSYPIHDALLVRPWPLAGLDAATPAVIVPAGPVVTTESALHGRQGAHLWTGGEGRREPVVQGAAVFDQLPPGQRWPTVHGAVKAPAIPPPGRRTPTEHGAVRLHVPPPGVRKPRSGSGAVLPGGVPLQVRARPAAVAMARWLAVLPDVRDGLLVARIVPVMRGGKQAWVMVPVAAGRDVQKPAYEVVPPDVLVVRDIEAQAAVYGVEVATRLPDQDAAVWPIIAGTDRAALEAVRLWDQRLDWGQYAPYFPWPEDNTRPYDPPQEPWPDTEPVDDPQNPPPNPVADPISGEPTYPAPGQDPATGDPAVLPPRDPIQVPDERDEDFDVDVEEGILLNFIARFWDIWTTYRVYYAHVTASEAVNHLFAMLAAWLNDNAYDARYWAIYWTIRDCGRSAVMEFCPTYLRREWQNYHEDHQDLDRDPPPVGEWRDDPVNPWQIISGIDADGRFWAVLRSAPGLGPGEESWAELEVETFHDDAVVMFDRAVSGAGAGGLESREVVRYAEDFEDGTAGNITVSGAGWSVVVTPTGNALKSDNTVAGDVAGAHLVVSLTRTGYVVFDYEVAANRLRVYVDDAVALDTGATDGWVAAHRIDLGPGVHTITWEVTDVGEADGQGRRFAQIDDIRVVEREPVDGPPVVDSYLEFYVNGVRRATWHGETPWNPPGAPATFHLGKGRHLLLWRFVRGPSNPGEDEKGMIDDIRITHVALARAWTETICQPDSGNAAIQRVWECLLALWNDRHRLKRLRRRWLVT